MIKREFIQFMQTLNVGSISDDVRKIANLVLKNLEILIPIGTVRGRRIKKIVELAQANWKTISSDIQPLESHATEQNYPFCRIKSLSVGPFRGFLNNEYFDLNSELVLIYGPNGTGKSSFCEALEFGLLGNVADAENKRFRNQNDYLKNAHTNSLKQPCIVGVDSHGNDIKVSPNETLYRFCFVEKNRIDSFARIAAQAPSKQTELISTLFGLDDFTEFVKNFTDNMDEKYIDTIGVKNKELNQKRQTIAGFKQQISTSKEELDRINAEESELANRYRNGISFDEMESELNGVDGKPGLIQQLDEELLKPLPAKSNLTRTTLKEHKEAIEKSITDYNSKKQKLADFSQEVSFKQLYESVKRVQQSSPDKCPACQTSLSKVQVNPYTHANVELEKLKHLSELQNEMDILNKTVGKLIGNIQQMINACAKLFPEENNSLSMLQNSSVETDQKDFWNKLQNMVINDRTLWQHIEHQVGFLEDADKEIAQAEIKRNEKIARLKELRRYSEAILKLKTRRKTALETIQKAQNEISQFETENALLIKEASNEKTIVEQNLRIVNAYKLFVKRLIAYTNNLPAQLVENLGDLVIKLYNAFNRNDNPHEQLANICLPLNQNERLTVSYKHSPGKLFDALHILSEGHIRCIGLAILAAKNIKENCPILIFDDPVNAIDDEHRESIRRTLFEDNFFDKKQIILACHGEEFFKDIQNLLPVKRAKQSIQISFLPKEGDFNIKVDRKCTPRNYLIASRNHYDRNEIREALSKSRQALEKLTKGPIWRYVDRYGDPNLSIKMRSPNSPIELRNLTEQLKNKIAKDNFADIKKAAILEPLEKLLGIDGNSREWRYLNKGTHEETDRPEFNREIVNEIILAQERIDEALFDEKKGD